MVWLGVGVLALVAWRRGARTRLVGVSIAFTAVAFWAVPYFAPGLTHGPGDALLLLAVTALAAWPTLTSSVRSIATYAAVFGAGTVFFSMLTGELPVAAGWLVAVTLAVARDHHGTRRPGAIAIALTAFVAFVLGAVATVAAKQGLSLMLSEPGAFSRFLGQLQQYTSIPPAAFGLPPLLVPYAQLARQVDVLTAGNEALGYSLIAVVLATIGVAAAKGWRFRRTLTGKEILLLVGATFIPVLWVMLLPLHTYIHAGFMVRIMVVPIAIAPAALLWSRCDVRPARVTR
jgi:hypothetical protein